MRSQAGCARNRNPSPFEVESIRYAPHLGPLYPTPSVSLALNSVRKGRHRSIARQGVWPWRFMPLDAKSTHKSPHSHDCSSLWRFSRAVTDRANRYLQKQRSEVRMQDKGFSQRSVHLLKGSPAAALKLLKGRGLLKAAVGIEPTNKGFAVRLRLLSPSIMECHSRVNTDFFACGCHSMILSRCT